MDANLLRCASSMSNVLFTPPTAPFPCLQLKNPFLLLLFSLANLPISNNDNNYYYNYYSFHFLFLLKQFSCFATNKINFFSSSSSSSYSHRIKSLTSILSYDAVTKPKQV